MVYMYIVTIPVGIKPWYMVPIFVINNSFLKDLILCPAGGMPWRHSYHSFSSVFIEKFLCVCVFSQCLCGISL